MKVLVTGGAGFIGTHLVRLLLASGVGEVRIIDRRTPRNVGQGRHYVFHAGELTELIVDQPAILEGVDTVFHLAWASVPESSVQNPVRDVQVNVVSTVRLLEQCVAVGVRRVVFLSSGGAVYGEPSALPIPETHPTDPISAYGISKLAAEKYLALFHRLHGLEYVILRPSVPYGEYQNPFGRQGAVAVFCGRVAQGKPITLWGDAEAIARDFFHVSDLARACVLAAKSDRPTDIYNIGGGERISLARLIEAIADTVGPAYPVTTESLPPRPFDVPEVVMDISKAYTCLGWQPTIDLAFGLERTWRWIRRTVL